MRQCGLAIAIAIVILPGSVSSADLDDVMCAICHFEQAEDFAHSVHYLDGKMLCNDCHGGLLFEADIDIAKAPETGFIGRPKREVVASVCGQCHSGPAQFFSQGPHHDHNVPNNPTCITCHQNHRVLEATTALLYDACVPCHIGDSPAAKLGVIVQSRLQIENNKLARTSDLLDSMRIIDPSLVRFDPVLGEAYAYIREADEQTHAMDVSWVEASVNASQEKQAQILRGVAESKRTERLKKWAVVGVWIVVLINILLLRMKSQQL